MYIRVRVAAGVKKEVFKVASKDSFLVAVKEPAEQNRANKRVLELVAEYFRIAPKQIRIISGHHSPSKILSVPDSPLILLATNHRSILYICRLK